MQNFVWCVWDAVEVTQVYLLAHGNRGDHLRDLPQRLGLNSESLQGQAGDAPIAYLATNCQEWRDGAVQVV